MWDLQEHLFYRTPLAVASKSYENLFCLYFVIAFVKSTKNSKIQRARQKNFIFYEILSSLNLWKQNDFKDFQAITRCSLNFQESNTEFSRKYYKLCSANNFLLWENKVLIKSHSIFSYDFQKKKLYYIYILNEVLFWFFISSPFTFFVPSLNACTLTAIRSFYCKIRNFTVVPKWPLVLL